MPLIGVAILFIIIFILLYISQYEANRICERTEDAVLESVQGVCLVDRYEYGSLAFVDSEADICFYGNGKLYSDDDDNNMDVTKAACRFAYNNFLELAKVNLPQNYIVTGNGGIESFVKSFTIQNIHGNSVYVYDIISHRTDILVYTDQKSTISVEMEIKMNFPFFGDKILSITQTGLLEDSISYVVHD